MNAQAIPNVYSAARSGNTAYVRVTGMASMKNAAVLDSFMESGRVSGITMFCIDLAGCTGMDSTFMGTLVGHAQTLTEQQGRLVIVRPSEQNHKLLSMLGVTEVIAVINCEEGPALQFSHLDTDPALGPVERMDLIRRAHQHLIALGPANQATFTPFLKALEADLARHRLGQGR